MKSKKVLSLFLSIGMLFSLVFPAFAADATTVTTTSNEYEYIIALKESSEEELFNMGLTR
ncbi:MAG: hypothetical protein K2P20_01665 [Oscillospiraceae bacterium]|nr:hypothetical protein [Oscillospiraceae bacterium]